VRGFVDESARRTFRFRLFGGVMGDPIFYLSVQYSHYGSWA
jgi:hypothetical protein